MCGIFGIVGDRWRSSISLALAALRSRGPDEQSQAESGDAVFAHTRLAVIDPAGGHQPMQSPDGRYLLVFNGEIYNFRQLRQELEELGYVFRTRSDTETVLHGYAAWGESLLPRLDGMFAFAVWDRASGECFAARDRLGIKPFMYGVVGDTLVFASTLAAFLALPDFPRQLDPQAQRDYLAFQTPLAPQTFLQDVKQLPPASLIRYRRGDRHLEVRRWWSIPNAKAFSDDRETLLARVDHALRESVRRQLVADVPLGAFLSGGIDSSLMVRYMAEAGASPLKTFSLRFAERHFDESGYAREVAQQFGCDHHVLDSPTTDGDGLLRAIGDLDQPLADPAYVMTHALSRLTRQHVTVAISGDGGDELFGGYPRFLDTEDRYPRQGWQPWLRRLVDDCVLPASLLRRSLWGQELLFYRRVEVGPWCGRKSLAALLRPDVLDAAKPVHTLERWRQLILEFGGHMDSASLMRADLWTYLSENCLVKTDRASMAHSLEVRVPMLGQPVLDAVLDLPAEVHFAGGGKSLLTELARRSLPENVWNRKKHGFSVPLESLFRKEWRQVCEAAIADVAVLAPWLDADGVRRLWREALEKRASRRLAYAVVVLLLWLRQNPLQMGDNLCAS